MHQDCDRNVEDVLFENDGLLERLNSSASQLPNVCNSLTVGHDLLEEYCGGLAGSHLMLE